MCDINPINFTTIEALPMELLIPILQDLAPIDRLHSERVCKKWRDASRRTWRDIQTLYIIDPEYANHAFKTIGRNESHKVVMKKHNRLCIISCSLKIIRCLVSRVGRFIEQLTVDLFDHDLADIIAIVSVYCQNLKSLSLDGSAKNSNVEFLLMLFEVNQELHSFKCEYMTNVVEALPFRNWKSLRFTEIEKGSEEKIVSLIEHSEALGEFGIDLLTLRMGEALQKLRNFENFYFLYIPPDGPLPQTIFDISFLNRLRDLKFDIVESNGNYLQYCNMLQHCSQLKSLSIYHSCDVEFPSTVLQVILALPTLETLQIGCEEMPKDLRIHLNKFTNLSIQHWSENSNKGILEIIKTSEFLENLDLLFNDVEPNLFKKLVRMMSNRYLNSKHLNVMVNCTIFDEVSEICAGSKIRLVKYMQCFDHPPYHRASYNVDKCMS